jgi:serine protease SohB
MEFLAEYGLFLLKVMTIVIAIVIIITAGAAAGRKATQDGLEVENLNKKYRKTGGVLRSAVLKKDERKKQAKEEKKQHKAEAKSASRPRSFVIDFKGDLKATAVSSLREEVSVVLDIATPEDEVIVRLENYGGIVHEHGLAASQLARIRDREVPLVVCVDKVSTPRRLRSWGPSVYWHKSPISTACSTVTALISSKSLPASTNVP